MATKMDMQPPSAQIVAVYMQLKAPVWNLALESGRTDESDSSTLHQLGNRGQII